MTSTPGHLPVLDKRFPKDAGREPSPVFDALIRAGIKGGMDPKFLEDEMRRAASQATVAAMMGEERFIQPIDVGPAALPPPPLPPYTELAPPGTLVLDAVVLGPPPPTAEAEPVLGGAR